jgi:type IV pilus assembly protein PilE
MAQARSTAGFTLIEVMIVLVVVAITTMIAASSYRGHVRRSHRVQAVQALLIAATEQEKFYLANGRYGDRLDAVAGEEPPGLPVASLTPGGHYALTIELANAVNYRIVATGIDSGADPLCRTLAIDESGRRSATDARGADSAGRCW